MNLSFPFHGSFFIEIFSALRFPVAELGRTEIQLVVERTHGRTEATSVQYETQPLPGMMKEGGILINPAIEGTDYRRTNGVLKFAPDQVIKITLRCQLYSKRP
jgi:hypothetical protein